MEFFWRKKRKEKKMPRRRQKFSLKLNPLQSLVAIGLGVLSLAGFITAFLLSSAEKGEGGIYLGLIGLGCFLCNAVGLVLALGCLKKSNIRYRFPIIGIFINTLLLIGALLLYLLGLL